MHFSARSSAVCKGWAIGLLAMLSVLGLCSTAGAAGTFNVNDYMAGTDTTGAFKAAFAAACSANGGTVLVPLGEYTVQPFQVQRCKDIIFQVEGTISAPALKSQWTNYKAVGKGRGWIQFDSMENLSIVSHNGRGVFDGKASHTNWWNSGAKSPVSLSFAHCQNLVLRRFTVRNSPGMHITVNQQMVEGQQALLAEFITIDSDGKSPNTDGIHLSRLWNAVVRDSTIRCGDDCVVFQTDCKNILVENIHCGPGHGISLGSLGNNVDSCMSNILVQNCTFVESSNGVRIKAWPNLGGGAATGITFRSMTMVKVKNPIIVSQCYSGKKCLPCSGFGQSVPLYDVLFEHIRGTCYNNQNCITISCLGGTPCVGFTLKDINLQGTIGSCNAAYGSETNVSPSGCLQTGGRPFEFLSSAAARAQRCGYGSRGYYTTSGPPVPVSMLRSTIPRIFTTADLPQSNPIGYARTFRRTRRHGDRATHH